MAIIVNGTSIPASGIIKYGNTDITKVNVIKDGVTTTVWEKISKKIVIDYGDQYSAGASTMKDTYQIYKYADQRTSSYYIVDNEISNDIYIQDLTNYNYAKIIIKSKLDSVIPGGQMQNHVIGNIGFITYEEYLAGQSGYVMIWDCSEGSAMGSYISGDHDVICTKIIDISSLTGNHKLCTFTTGTPRGEEGAMNTFIGYFELYS